MDKNMSMEERSIRNEQKIDDHVVNCASERIRSDKAIEKIWSEMGSTEKDLNTKISQINTKMMLVAIGVAGTLGTVLLEILVIR